MGELVRIDEEGVLHRLNDNRERVPGPENYLLARRQLDQLDRRLGRLDEVLDSVACLSKSWLLLSDSSFEVKWANRSFIEEFDKEDFLSGHAQWISLLPDGEFSQDRWQSLRTELLSKGHADFDAELRQLSGSQYRWSFRKLGDVDEIDFDYLISVQDISDESKLNRNLESATQTVEQVLEMDARPVLVVARNGRMLACSKAGRVLIDKIGLDTDNSVFKYIFGEHTLEQFRRLSSLQEDEVLEFRRLLGGEDLKALIRTQLWWGEPAFTVVFDQKLLSPLHVGKMTLRRLRTEQFVSSIFEAPQEVQESEEDKNNRRINEVLSFVGSRLGVSRAYLFQIDFEGNCVSNTHEWCADGVKAEIDSLQNVPIDAMPYWWSCMRRREPIILKSISDFPAEGQVERDFLEAQDVSAIAIYPVTANNKLVGFVGFDETRGSRDWNQDDLLCLQMVQLVVEASIEASGFHYESKVYRSEIKEILQGANLGFWRWNYSTGEVFADSHYCEMLGYKSGEYPRTLEEFKDRIHPDDAQQLWAKVEQHIRGDSEEAESVFRIKHRSGNWKWVMGRARVIERDGDGKPGIIVGTHLDISEVKEKDIELLETKKRLEKSVEETSSVISRICSELRTPLNAISGISEIFERGSDKPVQAQILDQLGDSIEHMSRTIQSLEYFTKVETGKVLISSGKIQASLLAKKVEEPFRKLVEDRNLTFSVNVEPSLTEELVLDERIYHYILGQLVDNAVKFNHEGSVRIQLYFDEDPEGKRWFVTEVVDSGIGFDVSNEQEKDILSTDQVSSYRRSGGLGLGLRICSKLANRMGGDLRIKSKLGRGTSVILRLPHLGEKSQVRPRSKERPMLLMAEDHPVSQSIGKRILQMLGYDVTVVENGKSALDWMQRNSPDAILLDMQMPIMSGWEFLEEFRSNIRLGAMEETPVIITSALDLIADEVVEHPVVDVIQKPYSIKTLRESLSALIVNPQDN